MTDQNKLIDAVNKSGFPLQIGLEDYVNKTVSRHGWKVIYSEHSWRNPTDECSGFIDLVLENTYRYSVLIVETKRVLNSSWIFLVNDPKQRNRRHAKSWFTRYKDNKFTYFGLQDFSLEPSTVESQYCVVDGQDQKSRPMLERVASDVVSATEGFANEEKGLVENDKLVFKAYFNVIVTTATLKVCSFNPADVSIDDGQIDSADFTEVPYLRFRKQLNYHQEAKEDCKIGQYMQIAYAKENTVFIVNAKSFPDFLERFEVDKSCFRDIT